MRTTRPRPVTSQGCSQSVPALICLINQCRRPGQRSCYKALFPSCFADICLPYRAECSKLPMSPTRRLSSIFERLHCGTLHTGAAPQRPLVVPCAKMSPKSSRGAADCARAPKGQVSYRGSRSAAARRLRKRNPVKGFGRDTQKRTTARLATLHGAKEPYIAYGRLNECAGARAPGAGDRPNQQSPWPQSPPSRNLGKKLWAATRCPGGAGT